VATGDVVLDGRFEPGVGQGNVAGAPLDQLCADFALQFANLHGERGLRDGTFLGGLAEMPVASERGQITQLTQGNHADKLCLSLWLINTIGPDRTASV